MSQPNRTDGAQARRSLTERATTRYLRLALRRGDEPEARRYARELAGLKMPAWAAYYGRHVPRERDVDDVLATFRAIVGAR